MIVIQLDNTIPHTSYVGASSKVLATGALAPKKDMPTYCQCGCNYIERVFAKTNGESFENDKTSYLRRKISNTDTISFSLFFAGVEYILTDSTYGALYDFTSKGYKGVLIEWQKVFNLLGAGSYTIAINSNILGIEVEELFYFDLFEFDVNKALNYVRIEAWQTGNILSSEFNYENLLTNGWYSSYRIKGRLQRPKPKLQVDNYLNKDYDLLQIQDSINNEYVFESNKLPRYVIDEILYDKIMANVIKVTDYYSEIIEQSVYCTDITDKKMYNNNQNEILLLKFTDKRQDIIKHN